MFAYCGNNPVSRSDSGGCFWDIVFDVASLVCSVIEVVNNPDDIGAWVGLVCDVVDVAIPCVGGLGEAARAADAVLDAAKATDDLRDAKKATQSALAAIQNASTTLGSGCNTVYVAYKGDLIEYVGITNDFGRRKTEWKGVRDIVEYIPNLDREGARFVEQAVIDTFGLAKNNGLLSNKINSIGVKNPIYKKYLDFYNGIQ